MKIAVAQPWYIRQLLEWDWAKCVKCGLIQFGAFLEFQEKMTFGDNNKSQICQRCKNKTHIEPSFREKVKAINNNWNRMGRKNRRRVIFDRGFSI